MYDDVVGAEIKVGDLVQILDTELEGMVESITRGGQLIVHITNYPNPLYRYHVCARFCHRIGP